MWAALPPVCAAPPQHTRVRATVTGQCLPVSSPPTPQPANPTPIGSTHQSLSLHFACIAVTFYLSRPPHVQDDHATKKIFSRLTSLCATHKGPLLMLVDNAEDCMQGPDAAHCCELFDKVTRCCIVSLHWESEAMDHNPVARIKHVRSTRLCMRAHAPAHSWHAPTPPRTLGVPSRPFASIVSLRKCVEPSCLLPHAQIATDAVLVLASATAAPGCKVRLQGRLAVSISPLLALRAALVTLHLLLLFRFSSTSCAAWTAPHAAAWCSTWRQG